MKSFDQLSRRSFLGRTLKLGAAGLVACHAETSYAGATTAVTGRWQIGCYTRPWAKYDYRVALDAIAEAGFKYAGLMTTNNKNRLLISVDTTHDEAQRVGEEVVTKGGHRRAQETYRQLRRLRCCKSADGRNRQQGAL